MNIRQIKLALTVGLLNKQTNNNALGLVRDLMQGFKEVCRLDLDVVSNRQTNSQYVQGFQLR